MLVRGLTLQLLHFSVHFRFPVRLPNQNSSNCLSLSFLLDHPPRTTVKINSDLIGLCCPEVGFWTYLHAEHEGLWGHSVITSHFFVCGKRNWHLFTITDINNSNISNSIIDYHYLNGGSNLMLILAIRITDITNSNCWWINVSSACHICELFDPSSSVTACHVFHYRMTKLCHSGFNPFHVHMHKE